MGRPPFRSEYEREPFQHDPPGLNPGEVLPANGRKQIPRALDAVDSSGSFSFSSVVIYTDYELLTQRFVKDSICQ